MKSARLRWWALAGLCLLAIAALYFFGTRVGSFLDSHNGAVAAVAGLIVAAFTGALWRSTNRLWQATSDVGTNTAVAAADQLKLMQGQLDAMKAQEALLEKSVAAGATSANAAVEGARTAARSADLASRQFLSTVRPRLIIRHIEYAPDDDRPTVYYTIANVGGSTAEIVRSSVRAWTPTKGAAWPGNPPYREAADMMTGGLGIFIPPGGAQRLPYHDEGEEWTLLIGQVAKERVDTILLGFIDYADEIGTLRRTAFCRRRITGSTRFEVIEDADYEYSD